MLSDQRKLLISSYIDGEASPVDTVKVRAILASSKLARDFFQGQLHISKRVRQAVRLDLPFMAIEPTEVLREIFARSLTPKEPHFAFLRRPIWGVFAMAFGIALWVGFGGGNPFKWQNLRELANPDLESKSGMVNKVDALLDPLASQIPTTGTLVANGLESGIKNAEIGQGVDLVTLPDSPLEENFFNDNQEPAPNSSEILASPIGPSLSLKKIDLVLPSVLKAKLLEATVLLDRELKGIVRLDLPTYQENEAVKRLVQTLKAEGCPSFIDPATEEKIKKNHSIGPVIIVIHGLDSGKICRAIQGTSKAFSSKNSPNQPASVFDEVIVGNMGSKEGEGMVGMLIPHSNKPSFSSSKSGGSENNKKSANASSNPFVFATISSASALRIPGAVHPRKTPSKSPSDITRTPVVLNIVPLR